MSMTSSSVNRASLSPNRNFIGAPRTTPIANGCMYIGTRRWTAIQSVTRNAPSTPIALPVLNLVLAPGELEISLNTPPIT